MPRRRRKRKNKNKNFDLVNLGKWTKKIDDYNLATKSHMLLDYNKSLDLIEDKGDPLKKIFDLRKAAEVHRQVRRSLQAILKPGISFMDIANHVENRIVEIFERNDLAAGIGFPTGISVNNIAAHDSANPGDIRTLNYNDVVKIDYGTHVNGNIIDSAFTVAFNPKFKPLLDASKDGTWAGIKLAGIDVRVKELSQGIQEAIESYEIELDGKVYPIKAVRNLGGHNIEPYKIHGGVLILGADNPSIDENMKMKENCCYAIETFATTGAGFTKEHISMKCNHYMRQYHAPFINLKFKNSRKVLTYINKTRGTLPFCTRWLKEGLGNIYRGGLNELVSKGAVTPYRPLIDIDGSYTSQLEHTIFLHEYGKEVLSVGEDY